MVKNLKVPGSSVRGVEGAAGVTPNIDLTIRWKEMISDMMWLRWRYNIAS